MNLHLKDLTMMMNWPSREAFAGNPHARANEAARILTTCNATGQPVSVPSPFSSRGRVLFATTLDQSQITAGVEELSERHELDTVLGYLHPTRGMAQPATYRLGVRLWWKILWHDGFLPWQPEGGGLACFVPQDPAREIYFWVEDGRLACDKAMPFADAADRKRGLRRAARAMSCLMRGR